MEIRGIDKLALDGPVAARLDEIAVRMSEGSVVVTRADVIRACIENALPVLERRVGIAGHAEVGSVRFRPR